MQTKTRRPALFAGVIAASLLAVSGIGASAQDAETAMVRVLHASPDAPAVDVYADGAVVLSGVAFGTISSYMEVPAGNHQIQVFAADADPAVDTAVIDATVTLAAGTATTVAATNSIDSIEAQVIADARAPRPTRSRCASSTCPPTPRRSTSPPTAAMRSSRASPTRPPRNT